MLTLIRLRLAAWRHRRQLESLRFKQTVIEQLHEDEAPRRAAFALIQRKKEEELKDFIES